MLVPRRDEILARTDPFDLAQAIDRYVSLLAPGRIKSLVLGARDRLGPYYRAEFVRLLSGRTGDADAAALSAVLHQTWSAEDLRSAFARLLKTNLRAIPMFGAAFCDGVLEYVPTDRAVAIGEEQRPVAAKFVIVTGAAAALVLAGAAGEHFVVARTQIPPAPVSAVASPLPPVTPQHQGALAISSPSPAQTRVLRHAQDEERKNPAPTHQPSRPQPRQSQPRQPQPRQPQPRHGELVEPRPGERVEPPAAKQQPTPPPARGVATVAIPDPTATPEPSPLDVSDMPDSYTDATPLPQVTAVPLQVPRRVRLVTPAPKPKRHKWLYRAIMHLDPFKPNPRSTR